MPESTWTVAEPQKLTFDDPVTALNVRIVDGMINVVGTDEPTARLEVSAIEGPPLVVTLEGGILTVAYEDLPWQGLLTWLDRRSPRRSATVSVAVPAKRGGGGRGHRSRRRRLGDPGTHRAAGHLGRQHPGGPLRCRPGRDRVRRPGGPECHR